MEIHIAVASDWNYLVHAGTLIRSIIDNNQQHELVFHLLTMDTRVPNDETLQKFRDDISSEKVRMEIHFTDENDPFIQAIPPGGTIANRATFLRFLAPQFISSEKLLYLDCDMIVLGDLGPLVATPHGNKILAAVPDIFWGAAMFAKGFGIRYFNAGMLVIDVVKWKKNRCLEVSFDFIRTKFTKLFSGRKHYGDQDVLNMLFQGQIVYVHPKYNAVNPLFLRRCDFRDSIFNEAFQNPVIVHFAGGSKPWNPWDVHPLAGQYWKYRRQTPWGHIPMQKMLLKKWPTFCVKWIKYQCGNFWYPIQDLFRRMTGTPSRRIPVGTIQYLMEETTAEGEG
ncbi:MAG: glycosyltransferase family 8 protein [Thermoguttaceae bacterium]